MTINTYDEGQPIRCETTITVYNPTTGGYDATDPTTVTGYTVDPSGARTEGIACTHDGLGRYSFVIAATATGGHTGRWWYGFVSTGAAADAGEAAFYVTRRVGP